MKKLLFGIFCILMLCGCTAECGQIDVTYNGVGGAYDTIYAVDFKNSDYAMIENNVINALGHTYIYGIILSGENFNINNNIISSESDNKYANGIDIEGPASGVIDSNNISVKGVESAYAIYSGMNGADVSGYYIDNNITAEAYNVFGMSLGDVESKVINNTLNLVGNYTTGIAYRGADANITGNRIILESSEVGNLSVWENFGVEAVGIKVIKGNASITDNIIAGPGKGVSLIGADVHAILEENFINVVAGVDKDAYAIYAENIPKLMVYNNTIDYQGTTQGTGINNAVYLNNANDAIISNNKFDLELVSSYVPWAEVPAGSGNWVSSPVSEGDCINLRSLGSESKSFISKCFHKHPYKFTKAIIVDHLLVNIPECLVVYATEIVFEIYEQYPAFSSVSVYMSPQMYSQSL